LPERDLFIQCYFISAAHRKNDSGSKSLLAENQISDRNQRLELPFASAIMPPNQ
jgi:hypothetical protein